MPAVPEPEKGATDPIMRILCVTSHSDRPETEAFIGLHRTGVEIEVLCPADAPHVSRLRDAGVPLQPLTLRGRFDRHGARAIRHRLQQGRHHILHLFNNNAVSNGLRAARGLPVKVVAYRGIVGNVSALDPLSWTTYLNPRLSAIVCVAEAVRQGFLALRPRCLAPSPECLVTIHKGHRVDWYDAAPADLAPFGIPKDAFVIACVANLRPRKGVDYLIQAMAKFADLPDVHLLLVGNMESPKLLRQIATSPMASRIHRLGFRRDAAALTAACDTVVLPAIRREGLPKVIIEGMAAGVPPIVTDAGGSPELVEPGISGLVVPPADAGALAAAIRRLRDDAPFRAAMGEAAKVRIARDFRVEDTVSRHVDLYRRLLS